MPAIAPNLVILCTEKQRFMHIGIAGNIGSGKSTLTRMLAAHYGWTPRYEAVTYNPYLEDYYRDIRRWSFNLEIYFLTQRFKDLLDIRRSDGVIIQDRTIMEGVHIFARNNLDMGNISQRDYDTYMDRLNQICNRYIRSIFSIPLVGLPRLPLG